MKHSKKLLTACLILLVLLLLFILFRKYLREGASADYQAQQKAAAEAAAEEKAKIAAAYANEKLTITETMEEAKTNAQTTRERDREYANNMTKKELKAWVGGGRGSKRFMRAMVVQHVEEQYAKDMKSAEDTYRQQIKTAEDTYSKKISPAATAAAATTRSPIRPEPEPKPKPKPKPEPKPEPKPVTPAPTPPEKAVQAPPHTPTDKTFQKAVCNPRNDKLHTFLRLGRERQGMKSCQDIAAMNDWDSGREGTGRGKEYTEGGWCNAQSVYQDGPGYMIHEMCPNACGKDCEYP